MYSKPTKYNFSYNKNNLTSYAYCTAIMQYLNTALTEERRVDIIESVYARNKNINGYFTYNNNFCRYKDSSPVKTIKARVGTYLYILEQNHYITKVSRGIYKTTTPIPTLEELSSVLKESISQTLTPIKEQQNEYLTDVLKIKSDGTKYFLHKVTNCESCSYRVNNSYCNFKNKTSFELYEQNRYSLSNTCPVVILNRGE